MIIQHANTITRRYLQNQASTLIKYTLFAGRHLIFGKSTRKHAVAGTFRNQTWWVIRCSLIDVPDFTRVHRAASCSNRKCQAVNVYSSPDQTCTSEHLTTGNVVQSGLRTGGLPPAGVLFAGRRPAAIFFSRRRQFWREKFIFWRETFFRQITKTKQI